MERQEERSLSEQISEAFIDYISKQKFQKGGKLPNEFSPVQTLCVGRGTIREAIKILESRNIVTLKHGAGTFVSEEYGIPDDPLGLCLMKNKEKTVKDMMDMCVIIEPEIAAMVVQYVEEEDVKELKRCCQEAEQCIRCSQSHAECDISFHTQIAMCSKNRIVASLTPAIASSAKIFPELTNYSYPEDTVRQKLGGGGGIKRSLRLLKDTTAGRLGNPCCFT